MNKKQFRVLLIVYLLTVVLEMLVFFCTRSKIPTPKEIMIESQALAIAYGVICLIAFSLCVIGFVGLFLFWPSSRYAYLAFIIIRNLIFPLRYQWFCISGWCDLFASAGLFLEGAIMTLCLVGPAKHLFKKKRH